MSGNDSNREVERPPALLSMQDSAINTILKNIGGYRNLITKKIAPPMRKILYEKAIERKYEIGEDQVWAALPYLNQHRKTEIFSTNDFASIFTSKGRELAISDACVSMEEFLQYLVEFVPNLRQLNIEDPRSTPSLDWILFNKVKLELNSTDLLLQMENLTHLSIIQVDIKFSGFASVCRESPNLQLIKANNILVDKDTNSIKKFLMTLESKFDHQEYDAMQYPREIGITLRKTDADKPCREAKVHLSIDLHDLFPSLTKLQISSLTALGDDDTQSGRNRLLRILRREGGTLESLILSYVRPELNVTFKQIFEHCNDLENLELRHSNVSDDEPIASFGQLKNLTWMETFGYEGTIRLDKVLAAPLLKKIEIYALEFHLGDKVSLLKWIRNRKILTQLTYFRIWGLEEYNEEDLNELASELRSLGVEVIIPDIMDSSDEDME